MTKITNAAFFFLAAGLFTSVTILAGYQILFAIPLTYYTYLAMKENNFKLPVSAWFLLAFTLTALVSTIINFELLPRPSVNFGKLKYFLYGAFGIFVMRIWLKEVSDKTKKTLLYTLFVGMVAAAASALYSVFVQGLPRAHGFTHTMRYGYGTAMILLPLLSLILHHKKIGPWFNWKIALFTILIAFLGMYFTYTRGALLGFLCGLPFVLYFFRPKLGLGVGAAALILVLFLGLNYLFGSGTSESRFLTNKENSSDQIRRSQWQAAIIATKEKPILGWGLSNFHSQLKRIKFENDLAAKDYDDGHSHNLFLEVSSGTGLVGLFFFLGWLLFWAVESFKGDILTKAIVIPFGAAFVISSQFEVTFDANNASMIFFLYALSSARIKNVKPS